MKIDRIGLTALCLMLLPVVAVAQTMTSGSIAGVVRDASGAVLPGVTVEAASPALIEKTRTVVTDSAGLYRIIDLRPGVYTVTFTLPGFSTFRRQALELTTGFNSTVNADMAVGSLEETVTVSGASPVVDTSNVRTQAVFARDTLDQLPISRTNKAYVALMLGATMGPRAQDVGGSTGEDTGNIAIHGNRGGDMIPSIDGMRATRADSTGGGFRTFQANMASVQEITLQTSGISAESETSGVQMNIVPREGGNRYNGYFAANYTNSSMQGTNLTDALHDRGLGNEVLKIKKIYDGNFAIGGPLKKDKLWFYTAQRWWGVTRPLPVPGNFFNKNFHTDKYYIYEPDLSRPQDARLPRRSHNIRLTWQASQKDKINFFHDRQPDCYCPRIYDGLIAPEAMGSHVATPHHLTQATWSRPATNRLLLEAGITYYKFGLDYIENVGVGLNDVAVVEQSTGMQLNSRVTSIRAGNSYGRILDIQGNGRLAASYVTGSHNFKAGLFLQRASAVQVARIHGDVTYIFMNAVPQSLVQWASPGVNSTRALNTGLYAQDQWTIRRMTLNLGVRYDSIVGWVPPQSAEAGRWVPARTFPEAKDLPNFKDLSPRLGLAYDLSGNGKTAIKMSVGRYLALINTQIATDNSPSWTEVTSTTRTWTDNGDIIPQESELGASSNTAFGTRRVTTRSADDVVTGFGHRSYNWQVSAALQHELRPGLGLNAGYYRTWYGNILLTDNLAVTPADFDQYCITAPVDSRLPNSGQQICGLYDVNPTKFGQVNNLIDFAKNYGRDRSEVYNGFDVSMNGRFPNGAQLSGGVSTGQTVIDNCTVADSPQELRFCKTTASFMAQTQVKLFGVYPLPKDFAFSATFQEFAGIPITASYVATSTQIFPTLNRNLSSGPRGTATIELLDPNAMREHFRPQLDVRLSKNLTIGRTKLLGTFEVFNALNASSVLQMTTRYGTAWLRPSEIVAARIFKFGTQITF